MYGGIKKQFFFIQVTSIVLNYRTESPPVRRPIAAGQVWRERVNLNDNGGGLLRFVCAALHANKLNPILPVQQARNMADSNQQCTLVIAAGHATARGNYENKMAAVCDTTGGFHYSLPLSPTSTHPPTPIRQQSGQRAFILHRTQQDWHACTKAVLPASPLRRVQITQHEVITVSVSELFHNFELLMHSECSEQAIS